MGVFVPIPNGAQAELIFTLGGEVVENRLWFTFDNPPITTPDFQGLADGVFAWHAANILPFLSSDLQLLFVQVKDWAEEPPLFAAVSSAAPVLGGGSPSHSANVACFVGFRWPGQYASERRNGNFVPGVPTDQVLLNTPTDAFRNAMYEGYSSLIDETRLFTPVFNWRWVVASAIDNGSARAEQLVGEAEGPFPRRFIRLGQRRKRLPLS